MNDQQYSIHDEVNDVVENTMSNIRDSELKELHRNAIELAQLATKAARASWHSAKEESDFLEIPDSLAEKLAFAVAETLIDSFLYPAFSEEVDSED